MKSWKSSVAESRYDVLAVLAHEMFHFIQYWNTGDMKVSQQLYTKKFNRLKEHAKRDNPGLSDLAAAVHAHARHTFKRQAEQTVRQAIAKYKRKIDAGAWSRSFPMDDIRWYAGQRN